MCKLSTKIIEKEWASDYEDYIYAYIYAHNIMQTQEKRSSSIWVVSALPSGHFGDSLLIFMVHHP